MQRTLQAAIAAVAVVCAHPQLAHADADDDDTTHTEMAIFEAAVALAIPTANYWSTTEHQSVDWTIGTDWESWKTKLFTTQWLKFDTNPFHVNSILHPLAGAVDYHIFRTNGFGAPSATLFAAVKGALWEYFVEYREDPSINDMVFNTWGGIGIGEPMYRFAQLWRGGVLSLEDRARTALLSPFDAFHDTYRRGRWRRPQWWHSIDLDVGVQVRRVDGRSRNEIAGSVDLDLVADSSYGKRIAHERLLGIGDWSRFRVDARLSDADDSPKPLGTHLETATSLIGRLDQNAHGMGGMFAFGTGFTYRKDPLAVDEDRLAIAHLAGLQLSLSKWHPQLSVRWDAALYADFGLVQALVFRNNRPFPSAPPFYSSVQADGYIDALGLTTTSRLRIEVGGWHAEGEATAHVLRQINGYDRDPYGTNGSSTGSATVMPAEIATESPLTAFGIVERRLFLRGRFGYHRDNWGIATVTDGAIRHSHWDAGRMSRSVEDYSVGLVFELAY